MKAPHYVDVEEAERLPGLRLVLGRDRPGAWSVGARLIFDIKDIPYTAVGHKTGEANEAICRWTGQSSAPAAMLDDERPRSHWSEIILLAERLQPEPALIPASPDDRMLMFGLCHEICGEDGLGWAVRCLVFAAQQASGDVPYPSLIDKYSSGHPLDHYRRGINAKIGMLERRLSAQRASGSRYLVGSALSAADLYWVSFSNLIDPLPPEACVMPDFFFRLFGEFSHSYLDAPLPASLLEHRSFILDKYIDTPIAL